MRPASTGASGSPTAWTPFATIRIGDYEQWIGGRVQGLCSMSQIAWHAEDVRRRLTERVAAPADARQGRPRPAH